MTAAIMEPQALTHEAQAALCWILNERYRATSAERLGYTPTAEASGRGHVLATVDAAVGTDGRPWVKVDVYIAHVPDRLLDPATSRDVHDRTRIAWRARRIAYDLAPSEGGDYFVEIHLTA